MRSFLYAGVLLHVCLGAVYGRCHERLTATDRDEQIRYPLTNATNYEPDQFQCWVIVAKNPYEQYIELELLHMDIESSIYCNYDFLLIREGIDTNGPIISRLCGSALSTVVSNGSSVYIEFRSNFYIQYTGFVMNYRAVDIPNIYNITVGDDPKHQPYYDRDASQGVIIDPNYYIPKDGRVSGFRAYINPWMASTDNKFSFIIWRNLTSNYIYSNSYPMKVIWNSGWSCRWNMTCKKFDGYSMFEIPYLDSPQVRKGDILSIAFKEGVNPIPYNVMPKLNFCKQLLMVNFTNGTLPSYQQDRVYNFTFSNFLMSCRIYAFQAVLYLQANDTTVNTTEPECQNLYAQSYYQTLQKFTYPSSSSYGDTMACYTIKGYGFPVEVVFEQITLDSCDTNYIKVTNGYKGSRQLYYACSSVGYRLPNPISSSNSDNQLFLQFWTAGTSRQSTAFKIRYRRLIWLSTTTPTWPSTAWPRWTTVTTTDEPLCETKVAYPRPEEYHETTTAFYYEDYMAASSYTNTPNYLTSPNFPDYYDRYSTVCYIIEAANPGDHIVIYFEDFKVESSYHCTKDYLEIRKGRYQWNPLWYKFCGTTQYYSSYPSQLRYNSNSSSPLRLTFRSDGSTVHSGFKMQYYTMSSGTKCKPTLNAYNYKKYLSYPSGNALTTYYPNQNECWTIQTTYLDTIEIIIMRIDLEGDGYYCNSDYLEFRDGKTESSPLLRKACGSRAGSSIYSTASTVYIKFHSDQSIQKSGFDLTYTTVTRYGPSTSGTYECQRLYAYGYNNYLSFPDNGQSYDYHYTDAIEIPKKNAQGRMCWEIIRGDLDKLELTFSGIWLNGKDCASAYMHVYDGRYGGGSTLRTYCPQQSYEQDTIEVYDSAKIDLYTDNESSISFKLTYNTARDKHGGAGTPGWAIGIITVSVLLGLTLIIAIPVSVFCCYRRRSILREAERPVERGHEVAAPEPGVAPVMAAAPANPPMYSPSVLAFYNPSTGAVMLPKQPMPNPSAQAHVMMAPSGVQNTNDNGNIDNKDQFTTLA